MTSERWAGFIAFRYRQFLAVMLVFALPQIVRAYNGNDTCPASPLGVLTSGGFDTGTTVGAAGNYGLPAGCPVACGSYGVVAAGRDVIYEFTVSVSGAWTFDLCSTFPGWDNSLQIRTGGPCPGTTCVAADGDGCDPACPPPSGPNQSKLHVPLFTGTTYYLIVDSYSPVHAGAEYRLRWTPPPVCGNGTQESGEECDDGNTMNGDGCDAACQDEPPANDDCVDATAVGEGSHPFDLAGSTLDASAPPVCDASMLSDIWFRYTPTCNGYATISTCDPAGPDTVLQIYRGCNCAALIALGNEACADDNCGGGFGLSSTVTLPVSGGVCHSVRLGGAFGLEPSGFLAISCFAPICGNNVRELGEQCDDGNLMNGDGCDDTCDFERPANDLCLNATVISAIPFVDDIVTWGGATPDMDVSCNQGFEETMFGVWYRYGAPADCEATITRTASEEFADTIAAFFTGSSCANLTEFDCGDDESSVTNLMSGQTYWLLVAAWSDETDPPLNTLDISFHCTLPGCGNSMTQPGEECDDGNTMDGDGCSSFCQIEGACCLADGQCLSFLTTAACGTASGVFQGGGSLCLPKLCPYCGNGDIEVGEECDDANLVDGDGCNSDCELEGACCNGASCTVVTLSQCAMSSGKYQGDGVMCTGQCGLGACCIMGICSTSTPVACMGAFLGSGTTCSPDPCPPFCGNGEEEGTEECDDGNTSNGDGCDSSCMLEGIACGTDLQCALPDANACTCDRCMGSFCTNTAVRYGNVNCSGPNNPNLDDILCVLTGFSSFAACPNGDLAPPCTGNNTINLDDILAILGAFGGSDPCNCPP